MRPVLNALLLSSFILGLVGCAQGPSSPYALQENQNARSTTSVVGSGSIGTEGGGNVETLKHLFWHTVEMLAVSLDKKDAEFAGTKFSTELRMFADNLHELFDKEHDVEIGFFKVPLTMSSDSSFPNDYGHGTIRVSTDFFQYDRFRMNLVLINFANQHGRKRLEWTFSHVAWAAFQCAPGTEL